MLIVCVCTYNEAALIEGAINSLWAFGCQRMIVVDGQWDGFAPTEPYHSTDQTRQIATALGAEIIQPPGRPWLTEHEARSSYFLGDPGDWYLVLDADERVSGALPSNVPSTAFDGIGAYRDTLNLTPRLLQQRGVLRYQYTHWTVYCDDVLLSPVQWDGWRIEHAQRKDQERVALKEAFYPARTEREAVHIKRGIPPEVANMEDQPGLRYVGDGAWLAGVPARDLTALEALRYAAQIAACKQTLYVPMEVPATDTPAQPAPLSIDDDLGTEPEQDTPAETPEQPTEARRKSRKE
jgi:hypothetical protein